MADEPRRSGRATKGQHKNASSSPAPNPKPAKSSSKSKPSKKSTEPEPEEEDDEEDRIRCICGDDNPKDRRAFIGCDACGVWQHNVCMGMPEDEEDVPDHYFCEDCRPEEHKETLQATEKGEKIWEKRSAIFKNEKKMSKSRKSKGKGDDVKPGWLKKDIPDEETATDAPVKAESEPQEAGTKRKRDSIKQEPDAGDAHSGTEQISVPEPNSAAAARPDKRRKSSQTNGKGAVDTETALVQIDQLPADRRKVAEALGKIISEDVQERAKAGFRIPDGHTPKSLGEYYASRIEYSLHINHGSPKESAYANQFRMLNANLKKNKALIERLLAGSLTADELSVMESKFMASEEQMRENARMKEELDRQAIAIEEEGPRFKRTHKGDEIIEDETHRATDFSINSQPVRERMSVAEEGTGAGSPSNADAQGYAGSPIQSNPPPLGVDTRTPAGGSMDRRTSSQQFDMKSIWEKTAQSPTSGTAPRPMQMKPRRRSSVQPVKDAQDGAKEDPDVDRLLQDDDETYSPTEFTSDNTIVWRGKLVHSGEAEPNINARFVAGRDLAQTVPWRELLPEKLSIDGRLQTGKAEEYLCSLEWSSNSDVSVLAFTPYDDAEGFNTIFNYFKSRERYAVVSKDKPRMVKDLYIVPVEAGARLPDHIEKLEHCTIKLPIEERMLLATFVVARAPGTPQVADSTPGQQAVGTNGQHHLPQHVRQSTQGPSGSPINMNSGTFPPAGNAPTQQPPMAGYGTNSPFPPNPYGNASIPHDPQQQHPGQYPPPHMAPQPNPLVSEVLGSLQYAPTAQAIIAADPNISREKLGNLRDILEEDPAARTNIEALAARLR